MTDLGNSGNCVMHIWELYFLVLCQAEYSHNKKALQLYGGGFYKQNIQQHCRQSVWISTIVTTTCVSWSLDQLIFKEKSYLHEMSKHP